MKKGFTLVEILVAITLFGIIMLSLASLFPAAMRASTLARQNSRAIQYCQQRIEFLRAISFNDPLLDNGTYGPDSLEYNFVRSHEVVEDWPVANMKRVTVTVAWNQTVMGGNREYTKSITTYLTR